ncbi:MAG TPA: ATP-binding protein, partial [Candidatus Hodarchaeales archaeon]|nr:ATP-binding protein [Candidatus Hodarchaeales archaeon]
EKNLVAQAISNMIENAVKYADRETLINISGTSKGNAIGIAVESEGIPISEADKQRLFERGFRGHSAMQKVPAGTGIGLYLASRVMKFHGGEISIEVKGKMSRFELLFPKSRVGSTK